MDTENYFQFDTFASSAMTVNMQLLVNSMEWWNGWIVEWEYILIQGLAEYP